MVHAAEEIMSMETATQLYPKLTENYWTTISKLVAVKGANSLVMKLNEYIINLESLHCFIILNNFNDIDLPNFDHPVVAKNPKLAAVVRILGIYKYLNFIWVPEYMIPKNGTTRPLQFLLSCIKIYEPGVLSGDMPED